MKSICVFCGSNVGAQPAYRQAAVELGMLIAQKGIRLVYGGGNVGLMGVIASTVLEHGGQVTGVIPTFLNRKEVGNLGDTEHIEVETMHQRKQIMADRSDGFIAMPGGMGTMEEMFEVLTWGQLGLHAKPFGLLNVEGYYDQLVGFMDHMVKEQFLHHKNRSMVLEDSQPLQLLAKMENWQAPDVQKWIDRQFT
jgi:uncharacterized protein (TIGR00730 family)